MNPRLTSSKTWTHFPEEFLEQVQDLVAETFEEHLIDGAGLHLEGRIYPEEILFRLGIKIEGQLKQNNFEVSALYNPNSQNAKKIMHHCIEAAASMMAEYFDWYNLSQNHEDQQSSDIDFPRTWTEFNFEGTPLFVQHSTVNTALEAEADKILGSAASNLVRSTESEDALDFTVEEKIKTVENEIDADFEDDDLNFEGERLH
jgi:hypothetical protein